jgi:hypothetical protein
MTINRVRCDIVLALYANVHSHRGLLFALVQQLLLQYSASRISLATGLRLRVLWAILLMFFGMLGFERQVAVLSRFLLSEWLEMSVPTSDSKQSFLALCHAHSILQFGTFTVKSGRISPYFFNAGSFCTASLLSALGDAYARTIIDACAPSKSDVSVMLNVAMHPNGYSLHNTQLRNPSSST